MLKERDEIVKRELNLIFGGVPESISDDNSVQRSHDSDFVLLVRLWVFKTLRVHRLFELDRDLKCNRN